ncbi:permease-like cell division protein FtsX [Nonomuraea sp. NPDC049750]|uniref:permease-like cell division protein FtsX n=1 Tax=Nonomuraea sp. NPDC049750 TaxID=3154738 RepID=UPI0033C2D9AA
MNSPVEERLRAALTEAGATVDPSTLRPLKSLDRRRRVDFRLLAVAGVTVVLAGAATVAALTSAGDEQRAVAANPPISEKGPQEVRLFLCSTGSKSPDCAGSATAEQVAALQATLSERPDVEWLSFEDQATAYKSFRQHYAGNNAVLDGVEMSDMFASFRVKLKPGADVDALIQKAKATGGVVSASRTSLNALTGAAEPPKMEVTVFLCGDHSSMPACGAVVTRGPSKKVQMISREGKRITPAQQRAVATAIDRMPDVASVHFEDQQEAYENFRRSYAGNKALVQATKPSDMPISFRLAMKPASHGDAMIDKLRRMPGVAQVVDQRCMSEQLEIYTRYGISQPGGSKMCATKTR